MLCHKNQYVKLVQTFGNFPRCDDIVMNRLKFSNIKQIYQRILKKRPVLVNAVQTGILISTGDIIAQSLIERKKLTKIDIERTLHFFVIGIGIVVNTITVFFLS